MNFKLILNKIKAIGQIKISKKSFLICFFSIVFSLALLRLVVGLVGSSAQEEVSIVDDAKMGKVQALHPIRSVPSYRNTFPDNNDVQISSAISHGIRPLSSRDEMGAVSHNLVFMDSSPYYDVDKLTSSIPYLVPDAAVLVNDIGKAFLDSLQIKGIPLHKIIVTSVLRTKSDISKLRKGNVNATENSCHLYGTTVDICYNRFVTVEDPDGPSRRKVRNDSLKWVLSEVLRDFRKNDRCHIKYEVKQGCFHLTLK
jgi:hypothetical protein